MIQQGTVFCVMQPFIFLGPKFSPDAEQYPASKINWHSHASHPGKYRVPTFRRWLSRNLRSRWKFPKYFHEDYSTRSVVWTAQTRSACGWSVLFLRLAKPNRIMRNFILFCTIMAPKPSQLVYEEPDAHHRWPLSVIWLVSGNLGAVKACGSSDFPYRQASFLLVSNTWSL